MARRSFRVGSVVRCAILALLVTGLPATAARAADVEGGADHPLVARFPGSALVGYLQRDWDAAVFPLAADIETRTQEIRKAATVEGRITQLYYLSPVGKTPREVFRSYPQAFAKAGLKTVFSTESAIS